MMCTRCLATHTVHLLCSSSIRYSFPYCP